MAKASLPATPLSRTETPQFPLQIQPSGLFTAPISAKAGVGANCVTFSNVNIIGLPRRAMPRVAKPAPFHIMQAIKEMGISFNQPRGYAATRRLYDRSSGNFKAYGWECRITYLIGGKVATATVGVADHFFPATYQAKLP